MRVIGRKEFLSASEGTMYCKGVRWAFDGIAIKGKTIGDDWHYSPLVEINCPSHLSDDNVYDYMLDTGKSVSIDTNRVIRDGCFNEKDVFLVFDEVDILSIMHVLAKTYHLSYRETVDKLAAWMLNVPFDTQAMLAAEEKPFDRLASSAPGDTRGPHPQCGVCDGSGTYYGGERGERRETCDCETAWHEHPSGEAAPEEAK